MGARRRLWVGEFYRAPSKARSRDPPCRGYRRRVRVGGKEGVITDKLLGVLALAIGGALAWFLFEPVMSTTAAHGVNTDTLLTVVVLLLGVLVGWAVVDRLRR